MTWIEHAACADMPTDIFVLDIKRKELTKDKKVKLHQALAVCLSCPVRANCLESFLAWPPPPPRDVIIAGLDPWEARKRWFIVNGGNHGDNFGKCGTLEGHARHIYENTEPCTRCRRAVIDAKQKRAARLAEKEAS